MKKTIGILIIFSIVAFLMLIGCPDPNAGGPTPDPNATPAPTKDDPGAVFLDGTTFFKNDNFPLKFYVNTGTQQVACYRIDLTYDTAMLTLDATKGTKGVEAAWGLTDQTIVNTNTAGTIIISGFDTSNAIPIGSKTLLFAVYFIANGNLGASKLTIDVPQMTDSAYTPIGNPYGISGIISILPN